MAERASIPVRVVNGEKWGDLNSIQSTHEICGEKVDMVNSNFSFAGGHRVRLYRFRKNVHWRIPAAITLDITDVKPASGLRKKLR
jgi:hypothetical protein